MNSKDKYTEKQISWVGKKSEFRSRHIFRVSFSGIWLTDLRPDLENLAKLSLASSCASMWLVFVTYPWWWGAVGRTPDLGAEVLGPHPFLPFSFPRGLAWSLTLLEPASHNLWNEMTKAHIHYQVSQNRSRDTLKIVRYCRTMWGEVRWGGGEVFCWAHVLQGIEQSQPHGSELGSCFICSLHLTSEASPCHQQILFAKWVTKEIFLCILFHLLKIIFLRFTHVVCVSEINPFYCRV